jgi:hypothetical protein
MLKTLRVNQNAIRELQGSFGKSRERKGPMKFDLEDSGSTAVRERTGGNSRSGNLDNEKLEMQKKMEAAGTPGPAHKALEAFTGQWKAEVKCWTDPGGPPDVSQGAANARWVLNGRFLEEEFHGQMMGKPFTGRSLMGYDNLKQTYQSVWVSDAQTSIFTSEGRGENGNKVITLEGKTNCPATGRKDIPTRSVFRVIGPDKHVFEMYDGSHGEFAKTMEITYTRK